MSSINYHILSIILASAFSVTGLQFGLTHGDLVKGQSYNFTYLPADGISDTISLVRWLGTGLGPIATLNVTAGDGMFTWTPWNFLTPATDYAFAVAQGSDTVHSSTFVIRNKDTLLSASEQSSATLATSVPASMTTSEQAPKGSHRTLNTGRKVGIGLGVTSAVLLLALGAYMLGRRTRKKMKGAGNDAEASINKGYKPELKLDPVCDVDTPKEIGAGGSVQELPTDGVVAELDGQAVLCKPQIPHELHANPERAEIDSKLRL